MTEMFGGASALYKNRFHTELEQLKYEVDDYVYYPSVVRRRWMWHQPVGGSAFSGGDFSALTFGVSGVSQKVQFNIPNNTVTDPTSYRFYFKCYVGDGDGLGANGATALCNYAHSVIQQLTVRFTGSASTIIEQVPNYNVFCNMLYQFYTTNYVAKFHNSLEGYDTTNANRAWSGRSFMLPLNVGFFMNLRKYIPNFCLPYLQIEFLMETCARALCQKQIGTQMGTTPSYYIGTCQLIVSEVEVTSQFIDDMREKISAGQSADSEVRLDFTSWTTMSFQVPASTTGVVRQLLTGNFVGIRKVMFGQVIAGAGLGTTAGNGNDSNGGADYLSSFSLAGLGSYRIQIGGRYFPDQEIYVNYAGGSGTTALNVDQSMGQFFNMYAVGCQNNNWADIIQDWSPDDTWSSGGNASRDFVFLLSTEFDDSGLPIVTDMINTGPLALVLNYTTASGTYTVGGTAYGTTVYVFVNVHRAIHIYDGNRATIVEG